MIAHLSLHRITGVFSTALTTVTQDGLNLIGCSIHAIIAGQSLLLTSFFKLIFKLLHLFRALILPKTAAHQFNKIDLSATVHLVSW